MKFTSDIKNHAYFRQHGRCGVCGIKFDDVEGHAHHINPKALCGANSLENCVLLCDNCHYIVHNHGYYRSLVVAPKRYFKYYV